MELGHHDVIVSVQDEAGKAIPLGVAEAVRRHPLLLQAEHVAAK